jgi:hypothetical protein
MAGVDTMIDGRKNSPVRSAEETRDNDRRFDVESTVTPVVSSRASAWQLFLT